MYIDREIFSTLEGDRYIGMRVIDAFGQRLNVNESRANSLRRFYFSSNCYPQERRKNFTELCISEITNHAHIDITKVHLLFFPMCIMEHTYLMSFNLKDDVLDIIDNNNAQQNTSVKYD